MAHSGGVNKPVPVRRARAAPAVAAALFLLAACGRGTSAQQVSSVIPEETSSTVPAADVATSSSTTPPSTASSTTARAATTSTTSAKPETAKAPCQNPTRTDVQLTYRDGASPTGLTVAGDGAVWLIDGAMIGRLGADGTVKTFPLTRGRIAGGIGAAPDGSIWFTQSVPTWGPNAPAVSDAAVGHIALDGTVTEYPTPTQEANPMGAPSLGVGPGPIVPGPDGAMWFIESGADKVGRVDAEGIIKEFDLPDRDRMHANPEDIAVGPDGALYVSETLRSRIARVDPVTGMVTELPSEKMFSWGVAGITSGPDGAVWYSLTGSGLGRMTTGGSAKEFTPPSTMTSRPAAWDLVAGPDGTVWFIDETSDQLLRADPQGAFSKVAAFDHDALGGGLQQLALADGAVWLAQPGAHRVTRISCPA